MILFMSCNKSFSPKPYLEDFEVLKRHISKSYSNLEPIIKHYAIDPYDLNIETIKKIKKCNTDKEAKAVLIAFAKTFKDGHFKVFDPKKKRIETIAL